MSSNWHVLRTNPRAEYLAADELSRDGFEVFFPRLKSAYSRMGHSDTPLFPGYLFLRCDPGTEEWPTFRPRHRVSGWLKFGDVIPTVPDDAVAELRDRTVSINVDNGLWRRYRPGEKVQIVSKTVVGFAEVVQEAKSPEARAKVLLQFMGRLIQADVPWEDLRPVEEDIHEKYRAPRRTRGRGRWIRGWKPEPISTG